MAALIFLVLNLGASFFKSRCCLEAENAALRQQLILLQRKLRGRASSVRATVVFPTPPLSAPINMTAGFDTITSHAGNTGERMRLVVIAYSTIIEVVLYGRGPAHAMPWSG
jgi:hypothetical protein